MPTWFLFISIVPFYLGRDVISGFGEGELRIENRDDNNYALTRVSVCKNGTEAEQSAVRKGVMSSSISMDMSTSTSTSTSMSMNMRHEHEFMSV